ncbi:MAG: RecQ family ATP-dependent DNA helicase [Flavobacterium sp.]|nr:RecQ family ATP-dependent DNA helicase [Flavobacterium sp.]
MTANETLKKYWNHDAFRSPQHEIILSVLAGKDTFGLMPTGGGKSICFQVPAMMLDGICLVICPLIALMKDQVANLQKRDIKAMAIVGAQSTDELLVLLDNCAFGNFKFLYLSPERLQNDYVLERIKNLPINLIAIDEAHCVSQWGHDFRPAYLKINLLKEHFDKVPFLALTATATKRVREDIIVQLKLDKPNVFQKSFARNNIAFMVFEVEDKRYRIEQILKKNPEPSIIYVRNRKACLDISAELHSIGINSTYYHGGLSLKEKDKNMQLWMNEDVQVIVATNAFGMGIDKASVKTIIHVQLPENIENYYQETGRAGRDGKKAFAVLLTSQSDIAHAKSQFLLVLPEKKFLKEMYIKLCNFFRIGINEGLDEEFAFNLNIFCGKYNFPILKTFNGLQFLDNQGIITMSQGFSEKISLQFIIDSKEVIRYISLNPRDEEVILTILRNYAGIYEGQTPINISLIARKSNSNDTFVNEVLLKLKEKEIINYKAKNNDITIIFNEIRDDERTINKVAKFLESQNNQKKENFKSVIDYVNDREHCKSRQILTYFGEKDTQDCGICSVCINKYSKKIDEKSLSEKILQLLTMQEMNSREIEKLTKHKSADVIKCIQNLLENNFIKVLGNNKYKLNN